MDGGEKSSASQKPEGSSVFTGWKKFFAPPTMIETEQKLETMDPTSRMSFDFMLNQLDILSRSNNDPNMKAQFAYVKADMLVDRAKSKFAEDNIWDFIKWILGTSSKNVVFEQVPFNPNGQDPINSIDDYPIITPWGNKPYTFLPDVKDFIDSIVDKRASVEKYIAKLKLRYPKNLADLWFWWKYIVHKQAIDGTVIEYARALEPYEFLPPDKLPFNPENGAPNPTYPYYQLNPDDPLSQFGNYVGPSFEVQANNPYNPNPPRYGGANNVIRDNLRDMIANNNANPQAVRDLYNEQFKPNTWAFDRVELEDFTAELIGLIDNIADPGERNAMLAEFGYGPADNGLPPPPIAQQVNGLMVNQAIAQAMAQYFANNPNIVVNLQNQGAVPPPQAPPPAPIQQPQAPPVVQPQVPQIDPNLQLQVQQAQAQAQQAVANAQQAMANAQGQEAQAQAQIAMAEAQAQIAEANAQAQVAQANALVAQAQQNIADLNLQQAQVVQQQQAQALIQQNLLAQQNLAPPVQQQQVDAVQAGQALVGALNNVVQAVDQQGQVPDPNVQQLIADVVIQNPQMAPQVDQAFVGFAMATYNNMVAINNKIDALIASPPLVNDYAAIKSLTDAMSKISIPSTVTYVGPTSIPIVGTNFIPSGIPITGISSVPSGIPITGVDSVPKSISIDAYDNTGFPMTETKNETPTQETTTTTTTPQVSVVEKNIVNSIVGQFEKIEGASTVVTKPRVKKMVKKKVEAAKKEAGGSEFFTPEQFTKLETSITDSIKAGFKDITFTSPYTDPQLNEISQQLKTLTTERDAYKQAHASIVEAHKTVIQKAADIQSLPPHVKEEVHDNMMEVSDMEKIVEKIGKGNDEIVKLLGEVITNQKLQTDAMIMSNKQDAVGIARLGMIENTAEKISRQITTSNSTLNEIKQDALKSRKLLNESLHGLGNVLTTQLTVSNQIANNLVAGIVNSDGATAAVKQELQQAVKTMSTIVRIHEQEGVANREEGRKTRAVYNSLYRMAKTSVNAQNGQQTLTQGEVQHTRLSDLVKMGPDIEILPDSDEEEDIPELNPDVEEAEDDDTTGYFNSDDYERLPLEEKQAVVDEAVTEGAKIINEEVSSGRLPPQLQVVSNFIVEFVKSVGADNPVTGEVANAYTSIADPKSEETADVQIKNLTDIATVMANEVEANPHATPQAKQTAVEVKNQIYQLVDGSQSNGGFYQRDGYTMIPPMSMREHRDRRWESEREKMKSLQPAVQLSEDQERQLQTEVINDKNINDAIVEMNMNPDQIREFMTVISNVCLEAGQGNIAAIKQKAANTLAKLVEEKRTQAATARFQAYAAKVSDALANFIRNDLDSRGELNIEGGDRLDKGYDANTEEFRKLFFHPDVSDAEKLDRKEFLSHLKSVDEYCEKFEDVMDTLQDYGLEDTPMFREAEARLEELSKVELRSILSASAGFEEIRRSINAWKSKDQYDFRGWATAMNSVLDSMIAELNIISNDASVPDMHKTASALKEDLQSGLKMMPALKPLRGQTSARDLAASYAKSKKVEEEIMKKMKIVEVDLQAGIYKRLARDQKKAQKQAFRNVKTGEMTEKARVTAQQFWGKGPTGRKTWNFQTNEQGNIILPEGTEYGTELDAGASADLLRRQKLVQEHKMEDHELDQALTQTLKNKAKQFYGSVKERTKHMNTDYKKDQDMIMDYGNERMGNTKQDQRLKAWDHRQKNPTPINKPLKKADVKKAVGQQEIYTGLGTKEQLDKFGRSGGVPKLDKRGKSYGQVVNTMNSADKGNYNTLYMEEWARKNPNAPKAIEWKAMKKEQDELDSLSTKRGMKKISPQKEKRDAEKAMKAYKNFGKQ